MVGRVLFLTGRLAAPSLRRILTDACERTSAAYDVCELPISVAALMTPEWALSKLPRGAVSRGTEKIVMPGRAAGDLSVMEDALGIPVCRGPDDLWDLPEYLGLSERAFSLPRELDRPKILAEITEAWRMTPGEILARAEAYGRGGADVIDLGGTPGVGVSDVESKIALLKANGFAVSVDAFHDETLLRANDAGADMLLSFNAENMALLDRVHCPVVVIPDFESDDPLASLERNVASARAAGASVIADPILDPPLSGFAASVGRFRGYREAHPNEPMLMGTGNVTELLEADSTGVNALLAAFMYETEIDYALTTEVAEWTRGAVRELALACRVMSAAGGRASLPKGISKGLRPLKQPPSRISLDELREMRRGVTDENWRVFVAEGVICAFNRDKFLCGRRADEVFASMEVNDPAHAFYLGRELQKAETALALGRGYVQDEPLHWGVLP